MELIFQIQKNLTSKDNITHFLGINKQKRKN